MTSRRANGTPEIRLSLRAAFCLSAPLVVGLAINQRLDAILFAIGALWAISQDGLDEFRVRGPRLLQVAVAAGVGFGVGTLVLFHHASSLAVVLLYGLTAVIAGVVETTIGATPGAYLLVGTIVGGGLDLGTSVLRSSAALTLGALWVFLVAALMNVRRRQANQRVVLAEAYQSLATLADALTTTTFYPTRARAVAALDRAQDVLGGRPRGGDEDVALRQLLIVALRGGEVLSYLEGRGRRLERGVADDLRATATTLRHASALEAREGLAALHARVAGLEGLDPVASAFTLVDPSSLPQTTARASSRAATRATLLLSERLRFAILLGVATATAAVLAQALDGPHRFWLPMSVAFIFRPDLGPVITRALARTLGTLGGVAIAYLVSLLGSSLVLLVVLSCVMAAVVPWASRRSHVIAVLTFTPLVFVFLGLAGNDGNLFGARVIDTALAAAIVLVIDLVAWSRAPSLRPTNQLLRATSAVARYAREGASDDPLRRNLLRRRALRSLADARASLDQAALEPRRLKRHDPEARNELDALERALDAATVALVDGFS